MINHRWLEEVLARSIGIECNCRRSGVVQEICARFRDLAKGCQSDKIELRVDNFQRLANHLASPIHFPRIEVGRDFLTLEPSES